MTWTHLRNGYQHVKGDDSIWVLRSGKYWIASVRGTRVGLYETSREARAAIEAKI
jgi:hypothetical protein